ncbi:hypothetical protein BASA61_006410 [Batrachochytrium salamandrivorans]|nr:hypothetical protein BASA61_006410 [Batrachochytrium salamandrivorans]
MWIDTAGTLPAGSQLTVLPATRLSCLIPIDSCSTVPSNQRWSRSASPFKTPPRSQRYSQLGAVVSQHQTAEVRNVTCLSRLRLRGSGGGPLGGGGLGPSVSGGGLGLSVSGSGGSGLSGRCSCTWWWSVTHTFRRNRKVISVAAGGLGAETTLGKCLEDLAPRTTTTARKTRTTTTTDRRTKTTTADRRTKTTTAKRTTTTASKPEPTEACDISDFCYYPSLFKLLSRALDPGVENVYTWLRGGVLNGEADLDQRWLDGTVEHESMGTRHDNRALAARLADFLQVAYRQYQSTLWHTTT